MCDAHLLPAALGLLWEEVPDDSEVDDLVTDGDAAARSRVWSRLETSVWKVLKRKRSLKGLPKGSFE